MFLYSVQLSLKINSLNFIKTSHSDSGLFWSWLPEVDTVSSSDVFPASQDPSSGMVLKYSAKSGIVAVATTPAFW